MTAAAMTRDATRAMGDERDEGAERPTASRWRRRLNVVVGLAVAAGFAAAPWWAPRALSELAFFRVRRVEIDGARYAPASELLARLRVDTTWSVWTDLGALAKRVEGHPLVSAVRVERRLPGTLRLVVTERAPVAMTPTRDGVGVLDADGRALPIDPSRVGGVDVPLVSAADRATLRLLGALRDTAPVLFARVSEVRRAGAEELRFAVSPGAGASAGQSPFVVRAGLDVTPARLADLLPVESDLARRRVRVVEIDLRFRDQVIARLP